METAERRGFFAYLNFNLPRLTKAALVAAVVVLAAAQAAAIVLFPPPFPGSDVVMGLVLAACAIFIVTALLTRHRPWGLGAVIAVAAAVVHVVGLAQQASRADLGAAAVDAALWNLNLFAALGYLALCWAVWYGLLVAHPDERDWYA